MKIRNVALWAAVTALGGILAACSEAPKPAPPANTSNTNAPKNDTAKVDPRIVKDEAGPDNSHITVRQLENGDQVSVRKWTNGPIAKVTRREKGGQARAIRVVYKSGKILRIEEKDAIDHALDWTAAQIDDAAKKSGKTIDDAPARDQNGDDDEK